MSSIRPDAGHSTGLIGDSDTRRGNSVNRMVAAVAGAGFVLAGLLGFTVTTDERVSFAGKTGNSLLGLEVNDLHNLVHITLGAVLLVGAAKGLEAARGANLVVGLGYLLVAVVGFFAIDSAIDILALNHPDNVFHLVVGGLLAAVALTADKVRRATT